MESTNLFLFVILSLFMEIVVNFKQFSAFNRVSKNDDRRPNTDILREADGIRSLSACTSLCMTIPMCSEVFFDDTKKKCVLTSLIALSNLNQSPGFIHLSSTNSSNDAWSIFENSYYLPVYKGKTWVAAQIDCMSKGSKLLELETTDEFYFIKDIAFDMNATSIHIGGTDALLEGTMIWWSTLQSVNLSVWAPGLSNTYYTQGEDCLLLEQSNDYKFNTGNCNSTAVYICERDLG